MSDIFISSLMNIIKINIISNKKSCSDQRDPYLQLLSLFQKYQVFVVWVFIYNNFSLVKESRRMILHVFNRKHF